MEINDFKHNIQKSSRYNGDSPDKSTSFYDNLPPINDKLFYKSNTVDNIKENIAPNKNDVDFNNEVLQDRFMTTNQYHQRYMANKPTLCVSPITRYDNGWDMLNKVNTYLDNKKNQNEKINRQTEKKKKLEEFTVYFGEKKESSKEIITSRHKERELADVGYKNFINDEKQKVIDMRIKGIEFQKYQQDQASVRNKTKHQEKEEKLEYEHQLIDVDHQLATLEAQKAQQKRQKAIENIQENQKINEQIISRKRQEQMEMTKRDNELLNERILMSDREYQQNQKHTQYINQYNKKYKEVRLPEIIDKSKPNFKKIEADQKIEDMEFENQLLEKKLMKERHKEEYIKNYQEFMKNKKNKYKKEEEPFTEEFIIPEKSRYVYDKKNNKNGQINGKNPSNNNKFYKIITSPINDTSAFNDDTKNASRDNNFEYDSSNKRNDLEYVYNLMGHEDLNIVKTNQSTIKSTRNKKFGL